MTERDSKGRPPEPGQAVAASTTKTHQSQTHARNIRSTDWLAAGERHGLPEPGASMTESNAAPPTPEQESFVRGDEPASLHEHIVSEVRAIQEALLRLGRDASADDVRRDLERFGVRVSREDVERVRACCDPHRGAPIGGSVPAPANPADLVRTEAERVPPPRAE
jgi:hypothetical protein